MLFIKEWIDGKIHSVPYFDEKPSKKLLQKTLKDTKSTMVHFNFYDIMYDLSNFNITHITLGKEFEAELPKLPNTLKYLHFETFSFFDQILNLPPNIEYLSLGYNFNSKFDLRNCTKLKYILINYNYTHNLIDCLPISIETIEFVGNINYDLNILLAQLPNLKKITFEGCKLLNSLDFKNNKHLNTLYFSRTSCNTIINIPETLTDLKLDINCKNNELPKILQYLPPKLTHLTIDGKFNYSLDNYVPDSLINLEIYSNNFNQNINNLLLKLTKLKKLILGSGFTYKIKIPENLKYLEILNDSHEQAELEGYNEDNDNEDFVIYSGEPYIGDINGNKIGNDSDSDFSICF